MPVKVKKNHQQVKRMMHGDVARGQNSAFKFLVGEAQRNAPRRTGHLASSIEQTVEATPERPTAAAHVGAEYGAAVDQGTAHRAGTYFWTRAVLAMYRSGERFFTKRR